MTLDENGFVIDVGKLDEVKRFMVDHFDHTLLLNIDDPELKFCTDQLGGSGGWAPHRSAMARIVRVPNCGMEGLAKFVYEGVGAIVKAMLNAKSRELRVVEVTCWEDSKNRAVFRL
jgi:6-pyruvoyltetrahydropterin/6-carboxytetrahydropterin synthase